ncbi:MAG: nuclear transport factor 2 family protein [Solimonas sp.]
MNDAERLAATEAIRLLKARYFRGVDGKDAALLRSVFTDDAVTDFRSESPTGDESLLQRNPDDFVRNTIAVLQGTVTVHSASMPELEILSATEARGRWTLHDRIWVTDATVCVLPFKSLEGWGYYHETYRCGADGWRIATTRLERLNVIVA